MTDETWIAMVKIGAWLLGWLAVVNVFGKTLNQMLRAKFLDAPRDAVRDEAVRAMGSSEEGHSK